MIDFLFVLMAVVYLTIVSIQVLSLMWTDRHILTYTPNQIYNKTKMNYFGCVVCWIGEFIFSPIYWIVMLVGAIIYYFITFIQFLFTVGRKK